MGQMAFDALDGVVRTRVGYHMSPRRIDDWDCMDWEEEEEMKPKLHEVHIGDDFGEMIQVAYNVSQITYDELLDCFYICPKWKKRSAAWSAGWYHSEDQRLAREARIKSGSPSVLYAEVRKAYNVEFFMNSFYQRGCSVQ